MSITPGPHRDWAEQTIRVSGLRLHTARRRGSKSPPLALVHGVGGSLDSWGPLLEQMADRDIIMIDAPGAGRSEVPLFPFRVHVVADYMAKTIRELGVGHADVLGYSIGGMTAQELVLRHPSLVRKLILVATNIGLGSVPGTLLAQRTLLSTKRYSNRQAAERELPILAGGRTAREPAVLKSILDGRKSHPPTRRGFRYQQMSVIGWTSIHWLHMLHIPTLVLHGTDDPIVPHVNGRLLASRIPYAHFEEVADAGHMLLFDESERVAPLIENFLDSPPI